MSENIFYIHMCCVLTSKDIMLIFLMWFNQIDFSKIHIWKKLKYTQNFR